MHAGRGSGKRVARGTRYTGPFRLTVVGYTRVRAIAVKGNMWPSHELDVKYGVEAQVGGGSILGILFGSIREFAR